MTALPAADPMEALAVADGRRVTLSALSCPLLVTLVLIWLGVAGLVASGIANPTATSESTRYFATCLLVACVATAGLIGMLLLDRSLAKSRLAMRQMREVNDLLSRVLEVFPIGIQIKDTSLRYAWTNAEHEKRSGRTRASLVGKTMTEAGYEPALVTSVTAHDQRVLDSGQVEGPEEQVLRGPDGQVVHITQVTKVPMVRDGKVTHVVTVSADLTTWRASQLRAEELRRLLETIMDAAPVTIKVTDRGSRLRWANRAFREQVGWPDVSAPHRQLDQLTPDQWPRDPQSVAEATAVDPDVFATGQPVQIQQTLPAAEDRPERHLLVTKMPIKDATGAVIELLTIGTDVTALKRAEAEADTANRLIEAILRNVPLSIQVKDTDLRFQWVNHLFAEKFGRDASALLGQTASSLGVAAEVVALAGERDRIVFATGQTMRFDEQSNVSNRHNIVVKAPILDSLGRRTHVITMAADVTELQNLRAEADAARRRLQHVLDAVPVTIALKDKDQRFLWVNREFERMHGADASTVIGRRVEEFRPGEPLTGEVTRMDEVLLATGADLPPMPQKHTLATGEMRDFSVRRVAVRDTHGAIEGILVVGIDVTELSRATAELRDINEDLEQRVTDRANELAKANELVATVVHSAPVPIVTFRFDGGISGWNPAAERVTGYSAEEARAGAITERSAEGQAQFAEMRRLIMRGEAFSNFEAQRTHKDGSELVLLISGAPLRRTDGTIEGAVGIWLDVTQQRVTEHQLRAAQRMEAVGQLTGGVAHDFNNLLAVVIGNLDLLLRRLPTTGDSRELVNEAIDAAERGAALTKRLLAFARQQTLRPISIAMDPFVMDMQPLLQRAVGEAVTIECIAAGDLGLALVDPSQLESAILNLSVNARDAMPNGGTLKIETRNAELDEDYAALYPEVTAGKYVSLCVSDNGTGIAPEVLSHVFEPFFTTKGVGQGSGLGLSMVFGFVKQSGGHVRLYSELGLGTSITLYLPRVTGVVAARAPTPRVASGGGETILLVEDNPQLRRASVKVVEALGYRVVEAENAIAALNVLEMHPEIALLFSDVVLPGDVNGFDLAHEVRRRRPGLPVLFTSGFADPSMIRRSNFEGDAVILPKPFRNDELAEKLRTGLVSRELAGR